MVPWLAHGKPSFPAPENALDDPNGLLAAGGELSPEWLIAAYQQGIFPWFSDDQPILWWSPAPRAVFLPKEFHVSRSLRKLLKKGSFKISVNMAFPEVIHQCATTREQQGTWINQEMIEAYTELHAQGFAHSFEVWQDDVLVGGIYGLSLGRIFFGESMFSKVTNASKVALAHLIKWLHAWGYPLVDCQVYNPHLGSLGAVEISRNDFARALLLNVGPSSHGNWQARWLDNDYE